MIYLQGRLSGFVRAARRGFDYLHVEGTGDFPGFGDFRGDFFEAGHYLGIEVDGGEDESCVPRVYPYVRLAEARSVE